MKSRWLKAGIPALLVVALVAGLLFAGVNAQGGDETVDEKNPLLYDAQAYASETGVSINEALRRLRLQDIVGELDAELAANEKETFAGLWIEHTPEFRVVAQFTYGGEEVIKPYLEQYPEIANIVEVRTAGVSLAELRQIQASVTASIRALDVPVDSGINVRENSVELYVAKANLGQLNEVLQEGLRLPDKVSVVAVEKLAEPAAEIYGGLPLSTCTSGFSVKKGWIFVTKGITTAGHCSDSQYYNGDSLPFQAENVGGPYDTQWHTAPGYTVTNKIQWWSDGSTRDITAKKGWSNQVIGEYVCKYGKTTHYTCGTIIDKNFAPSYIEDPLPSFIRVTSETTDLAEPGDSGSPWFLLNTAYGTTSGHIEPGNDAIYMAVNYIESGLGVSVMTSP